MRGGEALGKVSSRLREARQLQRAGMGRAAVAEAMPGLELSEDAVAMELRLWSLTPDTLAQIAATGVAIERSDRDAARVIVRGSLDALEALAAVPAVSTIHPLYGAFHRAGAVVDDADAAHAADQARAVHDIDGSGVRVGIISDSFNSTIGGAISGSGCARMLRDSDPQRSGDLPVSVAVLDSASGSDEGAGMAELVHDLAPGADLLFNAAGESESSFATAVDALRSCGADVVVDDLIFYAEPMFQDGPVAQAMRRAVEAGVAVFSAAGNEADLGVAQTMIDPGGEEEEADQPSGADLHDFGGGEQFAAVTLPAGCGVTFVLQWAEPFSGALGAGAASDLDLWIYGSPDTAGAPLGGSVDAQGCALGARGGDPLEIATVRNTGRQPRTVYVAIDHFCGSPDLPFRLATFPYGCNFPGSYDFDAAIFRDAQIYGHPAASGVTAVGAVDVRELASGGTASGTPGVIDVEPYSSLGGELTLWFAGDGSALRDAEQRRFKPELAAADGSNTTFFGSDSSADADSLPNFYGTSAAAPHAAAVAALLRQANPALDPGELVALMRATARDVDEPGEDPRSGAGAIDALAAVGAAVSLAAPTATPTALTTPGDCDGDGHIAVDELVRGVAIALGDRALTICPNLDSNADGQVSVDELIAALSAALAG
jgi:subtilisin family serine protease